MALYDDLDTKQRTDKVDGWGSGIKLLQSQHQLALKKTSSRILNNVRKTVLPPVIDLKSKREHDDILTKPTESKFKPKTTLSHSTVSAGVVSDYDWDVVDEYDPMWPNDYEKLVKEKRDKERDKVRERDDRKRDHRDRKPRGSRFTEDGTSSPGTGKTGFGGRPQSDDEDSFNKSPPANSVPRSTGATIAPPLSLQEEPSVTINLDVLKSNPAISYGSSSVAAKIMAKYGFKDGQGLGKQEQGMSMALQVEKTSKRGGRIIHEKELIVPPPIFAVPAVDAKQEPTITEIMKSPSKVVLLRNMVGTGDVDNDLEPEVKDECNEKYGEVIKVIIHEFPDAVHEEAVRIFVEFKRIESAIKAVVDLNGRFFGGRQVRAGFYNVERFQSLQLTD